MKISLKWLQDYVDVGEFFSKPRDMGKLLTHVGLELENIESEADRFRHVVIGCVEELKKHPQADRLTLCQVDTGEGKPRPIVCGAKNHRQGDKVVVALPGACLPAHLVIQKSRIRGMESWGMMCSNAELGHSEDSDGIKILPKEAPVGTPYGEYVGLDDVVFELGVTPNRADCLSHVGLARELACILNRELRVPGTHFKTGSTKEVGGAKGDKDKKGQRRNMEVELKSPDLCPRYAGCQVTGVKVGKSPGWMRTRLEAVGIHPINNVVDITNYVMMELGQPLHAFDSRFIQGHKIIIDRASQGETFTTLDGTEVKLTGEELTIRDSEKAMALAGVVGGINSGVKEETKNIFIESAHFTPKTVRQTSRRLGIDTDSAYRFARGTDPNGVELALKRTCHLMQQITGGEVSDDFYDEYLHQIEFHPISVRHQTLEDRLGYPVAMDEFNFWMKRLGCELIEVHDTKSLLKAPTYRWDLNIEMDFVEEYARLHGYDKIPEVLPPLLYSPTDDDSQYKMERMLRNLICEQGYLQALNYHFIGEKLLRDFLGDFSKLKHCGLKLTSPVKILNPLSEDANVMRSSLIPGLVQNMLHNYRHGSLYGRLFEVGNTFAQGEGEEKFIEKSCLSLMAWGQKDRLWHKSTQRPLVYDIKSSMESLFLRLRSSSFQWRELVEVPDFIHPGQCAGLFFEGHMLGFVGSLHPALKESYKLRHDVAMGEFLVNNIMHHQPRKPRLKSLSKYPSVERDFAFVLPDDLKVGEVIRYIKKSAGNELQSVEVFDDYRGQGVDKGYHSVAFRLVYQDEKGTLSESRISELHQGLISAVTKKFSVVTR